MASKQKLRRKITRLTHLKNSLQKEIQVLVFEPNSIRASEIKVLYRMLRGMEETVFFGTCEWRNSNMVEQSGEMKSHCGHH